MARTNFVLAGLLTYAGCAYYSSNITADFMNHSPQFAPSQAVSLAFNPKESKSGGDLFFFGYSIQDGTYALSIRFNVDDPQYTKVVIGSFKVFPKGKTKGAIDLLEGPLESEFEPFSYCTIRSGERSEVKRYKAKVSLPARLATDAKGYAIDITGHFELSNGTTLELRILDYVTFTRDRDLVPMYKVWEQI